MWIYDHHPSRSNLRAVNPTRWMAMNVMNILFMGLGMFAMVAGTYGSVVAINDKLKANQVGL